MCQHQEAIERESLHWWSCFFNSNKEILGIISFPPLLKKHGGFIAALNCKRQYLITILIVIIVIIEHLFI